MSQFGGHPGLHVANSSLDVRRLLPPTPPAIWTQEHIAPYRRAVMHLPPPPRSGPSSSWIVRASQGLGRPPLVKYP